METKPRYLTKSRFILGLNCPAKLYYYGKKEYPNRMSENEFMQSLADGGYQVGELARYYHPGGTAVETLDSVKAIEETNALLLQENAIIYEAAFQYQNLFVRADVVIKKGNKIELIEVKAKSFRSEEEFLKKREPGLSSTWEHYLQDAAYQKYVITKSHPEYKVQAYLMLADKTKKATVDELNQKFFITRNEKNNRTIVVNGDVSLEALGEPILTKIDVNEITNKIISGELFETKYEEILFQAESKGKTTFEQAIQTLAYNYAEDIKIHSPLGTKCKTCEYKTIPEEDEKGKKNGYIECWKKQASFTDDDFKKPLIIDIWNWRERAKLIEKGIYFQEAVHETNFPKLHERKKGTVGLTPAERQWLQIQKSAAHDTSAYLDIDYIKNEFASFIYPLHMIDFETTMAAIPFHKGKHPYEQIAFQFSHHKIESDGTITHAGEFISSERGVFPNYTFVRALKAELDKDQGTIFRYATHENTVLNQIREQLLVSKEPDSKELIAFIETITHKDEESRKGSRDMYDMLELVKKGYYHISMKGSNSIKYVLPAILNSSDYLKKKYSEPVYGNTIKSCNFENFRVVEIDNITELVKNPYQRLVPVLDGLDKEELNKEFLYDDGETIKEGGAAASAFGRLQYTAMTDLERNKVMKSLFRYCEIDTLAMVLVWDYFNNEITLRAE